MRSAGRRAGVLALALTAIAGSLRAQTLNPVVTVLPRATSTVPQDCEQGLTAAPAPRVTPEEKKAAVVPAPPTVPVAPPSASLRDVMRDLQGAAERGDREAFRTLFARAKSMVANYPPGAEKNAAGDALKVYEDVAAFLDYQYDVPTGAFFDASTDGLLARMKAYPDYQRAIADQTIVDANGTRFYPTRETRAFLVREAASRLRGVRVSTPVAPQPPKVAVAPKTTSPKVSTAPKSVTKPAPKTTAKTTPKTTHTATKRTPSTAPKTTTTTTTKTTAKTSTKTTAKPTPKPTTTAKVARPAAPKATTKREPVRIAESHTPPKVTEKPAPRKSEPVPPPTPPKPSAVPPATQTTAPPPPPPAPAATQTQTAATETAATTTTATSSVAPAPPSATTSTESTTTEGTAPSTKGSHRNLILPLILIVVGVGVLILLFRTSS